MKPESHRPAGQLRGERTVRNFLFCPHYQPHSLPSSPCPGSRAHCPWLPFLHAAAKPTPRAAPQLRGEHLLSIPVALGLTRSIRIPPSTSIPEGSGAAAHPFSPRVPSGGSSLTVEGQAFAPIKDDLATIGGSGQNRVHSGIPARLRRGQRV